MQTSTSKTPLTTEKSQKISKLGKAMRKGVLKNAIIELSDDVWGLKAV
jgi:hypothetical protein